MIFPASSTLSSLQAQAKDLAVSADNVANARTRGLPLDGSAPTGGEYVPRRVVQTSGPGGVVQTQEKPVSPPSVPVYNPADPNADADGIAAQANVDLVEEFVVQIRAENAFKANVAALKVQDEVLGSLLDIKS
ncbi:MAG: flagellar basal body rod C-terminal domain-containing protein [Kiloniellales bacterium]|nr:flagellar basal body rod C-terminal domain-containing protein [Kiloniellales bacterium]